MPPYLCAIFDGSLGEGTIPLLWKCADIRTLPKVPLPKLIHKDLWPLSLTPVFFKCFEQFICAWVTAIAGDQVDPLHYGSVKGTSTVHALIEVAHRWNYARNSTRTMVCILLVDFSKAFDRVDHDNLMIKCASLGVPNIVIKCLTFV